MTRTRMGLILSAAGVAGVLGLAGCGAGASHAALVPADVADEAVALQQVGFDTGLTDTPSASPSASTSAAAGQGNAKAGHGKGKRKAVRRYLRKNTLHGEITVQGKDGTKTIEVQRGAVTAASATSVTVKSTDGFTETWTVGAQSTLIQDKKKVQASALKAGEQIGVAGTKSGSTDVARLLVIK